MKICTNCKLEKDYQEFFNDKSTFDGLSVWCRKCKKDRRTEYYRTKDGVIAKIYATQKQKSKKRKMPQPSYNIVELREWAFSQNLFHQIFNDWKNNYYEIELVPSIDRRDDYKPYSLDNLNPITIWGKHNKKGHKDRIVGNNKKGMKSVIQLDTSNHFVAEYFSVKEAERVTKINQAAIIRVCRNKEKTAGNYHWQYKENI